jgi:hypothetical protein
MMQRLPDMRRAIVLAVLAVTTGAATLGESILGLGDVPPPARAVLEAQASGRPILAVSARAGPADDIIYEALVAGDTADVDVAVNQRGQIVARFILPRAAGLDGR